MSTSTEAAPVAAATSQQQPQVIRSSPSPPAPSSAFKLNAICEKLKRSDVMVSSEEQSPLRPAHATLAASSVATGPDFGSLAAEGSPVDVAEGVLNGGGDDGWSAKGACVGTRTRPYHHDSSEDDALPRLHPSDTPCCRPDQGPSRSRNKRKNFKPRNIVYQYADSDDVDNEFLMDYSYHQHDLEEDEDGLEPASPSSGSERSLSSPSPIRSSAVGIFRNPGEGGPSGEQPLDLSESGGRKSVTEQKSPVDLTPNLRGRLSPEYTWSSQGEGKDAMAANSSGGSSSSSSVVDLSVGGGRAKSLSPEVGSASSKSAGSVFGMLPPGMPHLLNPFAAVAAASGGEIPPILATADASLMKDYAETTMKELLGIYGLNDMVESITKHVPLQNFSSGKILESMAPHQLSCLQSLLPAISPLSCSQHLGDTTSGNSILPPFTSSHQVTSAPSSVWSDATTCSQAPSIQHSSLPSAAVQPPHLGSEGLLESLRTKVVDSMSRLTTMPQASVQHVLPQNMATTILTLAALGTKVAGSQQVPEDVSALPSCLPSSSSLAPDCVGTSQPSSVAATQPSSSMLVSTTTPLPVKMDQTRPGPIDYTRYVRRYANATECGNNYCKDLNYREHFHCLDCNSRVFVKKEEMIRHFKWHKKRDESLQHGFMRYSPMDDCSDKFPNCSHNRKQTHYHCLKESCDKVYISTSDVQMHANYHRKDSAIIQEGFQRFRATEDCGTPTCSFFGQRTTHFHCRRTNCSFTFKNKADMEKHKTYHIKDEQLNKDGFKKFMKHEHCIFENCRFSRVCNHIHCIRPGCTYVLHSSGQLYSHKRKHERKENEMAYRKFKLAQSMMKTLSEAGAISPNMFAERMSAITTSSIPTAGVNTPSVPKMTASTVQGSTPTGGNSISSLQPSKGSNSMNGENISMQAEDSTESKKATQAPDTTASPTVNDNLPFARFATLLTGVNFGNPLGLNFNTLCMNPETPMTGTTGSDESTAASPHTTNPTGDSLQGKPEEFWSRYLARFSSPDPCKHGCDFQGKQHFHCTTDNCDIIFRGKDVGGVAEHAKNHEQQDQITESYYITAEVGNESGACSRECPHFNKEKHYHCGWEGCQEVISGADKPFRRMDHYKMHEYARKISMTQEGASLSFLSSVDGIFRRKRGRPPKNRVIEFPMTSASSHIPQAIYTSFKLPKPMPQQQQGFMTSFSPFTSSPVPFPATLQNPSGLSKGAGAMPLLGASGSPIALVTSMTSPSSSVFSLAGSPTMPVPVMGIPISVASEQKGCGNDTTSPSPSLPEEGSIAQMSHLQLKPEAFSSFSRLKPHMMKHSGAPSPVPLYPPGYTSPSHSSPSSPSSTNKGDGDGGSDSDDEGEMDDKEKLPRDGLQDLRTQTDGEMLEDVKPIFPHFFPWQPTLPVSSTAAIQSVPMSLSSGFSITPVMSNIATSNSMHFTATDTKPSSMTSGQSRSAAFYGTPSVDFSAISNAEQFGCNKSFAIKEEPMEPPMKKIKIPSIRILKDEPVPAGYIRYRFNEDCGYSHCGYREHQTHFHCMRKDCGYSFCDKTRFVQHTARHERLDTLMGGDFQQFRANINCGRPECIYANTLGTMANKASHFHCVKCNFVCTDTNKVVAHRRQHAKMDSINAAGFEKYTPSQNCNMEGCNHNQKQTHYHCLKCQYAVLGLSQMSSHKYRHME